MRTLSDVLRDLPPRALTIVREVFVETAIAAHDSIVNGSVITGAPGQPVDTGTLKASWQLEFPSPIVARVSTNVEYAEAVEDGVGPHGPVRYGKSGIGGSHSVQLTILGLQPLADAELAKKQAA